MIDYSKPNQLLCVSLQMNNKFLFISMYMGLISLLFSCFMDKSKAVVNTPAFSQAQSIFETPIELIGLDQTPIDIASFKGKKMLVVNTASKCGFTPQYKELEQLHQKHGDKLVIIGAPCNQFGNQEPGSAEEIGVFCQKNYGVSFLMTDKLDVKGKNQHSLYSWLTKKELNGVDDFEVSWNFNKFLLDENGKLTHYFGSSTSPSKIEEYL
jgi:glutathione peroxidase